MSPPAVAQKSSVLSFDDEEEDEDEEDEEEEDSDIFGESDREDEDDDATVSLFLTPPVPFFRRLCSRSSVWDPN